ncbi:laminin subunit gamma-3 [Triplophysa dalaica]|uniref:laminin subunit gamma-3 n=1 Tax=Triplophysa dalaica TaxID=1582913 RepID=UPI0024DFC7DB|nr:laminin subunit gamma-3 [Triplophysa dalaica]
MMNSYELHIVLSFLLLLSITLSSVLAGMDSCYDEQGNMNRCLPKFENAGFNRSVIVSNVCGIPPEDYCMQTGSTQSCHHCDAFDSELNHNATYLTDFHIDEEHTWWQSQSMFYGVQYPNSVNITLHLGKAFEITYVRLKFYSSRPESFAIYKRTEENGPWQPYQYYSASCRKTYERDNKGFIRPGDNERTALCTDEFSDISPLAGGNVAFSTIEGRPSAYNFDQSPVLQDWVTATDILISLDRLNTFGDEFLKDAKVLRSYFYAISDFSVGGRCKCNGHASECVTNEEGRLMCACEHHTAGVDCERCAPFYQDRPWARATADSANQCVNCNCSGLADECVFDVEQYRSTGSGGRCVGCRGNTAGPHCERCIENFYRSSPRQPCQNCSCNVMGSVSLQCDAEAKCLCWPGVSGVKCDICKSGFHSLGPGGCRLCECDERGSGGVCSAEDGRCHCKTNVEGHSCNRCKLDSFNLQLENPEGCKKCFCFGHSLACSSSNQHTAVQITSNFLEDPDGWRGVLTGGQEHSLIWKEGEVYLLPEREENGFYKAPDKFLGNMLLSYGRTLSVSFTAELEELLPRSVTVVLESSVISVAADLYPPQKPRRSLDKTAINSFTLRLTERDVQPSISQYEFLQMLYNLTALHISNAGGQNYTSQLFMVTLESAVQVNDVAGHDPPAPWVEMCSCPTGFTGQFCELCASGFTRETPNGGPFSSCVPCNCNQHGNCHPETGVCECTDFTTGLYCERCQDGYYGYSFNGSPGACSPCPCPDHTTCSQVPDTGDVVCTNCPTGQRGVRCELCDDGFYGNPLGWGGEVRPCVRCECNGNVDPNAVGVCDHMTGRCLKCVRHTTGDHCEKCRAGYYGNALDDEVRPEQKCKPCACNVAGTSVHLNDCHPDTGSCVCLSHVTGRDCGQCEVGYFNLQPGLGCEMCNCHPIGSSSSACHPVTGQCICRTGVEGMSCDSCRTGFFGFSSRGCRACNCDPMGSTSMQCYHNGTCSCRQGIVGYKCDKCERNYYQNRLTHQCEECPVCYSLVRDQAIKLKAKLQELETLLASYDCNRYSRQHPWRQPHRHQHNRLDNHIQKDQDEDFLPNALEDLIAIQEAREAFVRQFSQLETSAQTLQLQLRSITAALNCNLTDVVEESEKNKTLNSEDGCRELVDALSAAVNMQEQLQKMTNDLNSMVIPSVIPKEPNKWNAAVNESKVLVKSHTDMAAHIEQIAEDAFQVSNRAHSQLIALLEDNSTESHIQDLKVNLVEMQQLKENLTREVNETRVKNLSLQKHNSEIVALLKNIKTSISELHRTDVNFTFTTEDTNITFVSQTLNETNFATTPDPKLIQTEALRNITAELDITVQSTEHLFNKTTEEIHPLVDSAEKHLKTVQELKQLTSVAEGFKVSAISSVVTGKEIEEEILSLQNDLEDIEREWPRLPTLNKEFLKKEKVIKEKILVDVKKKVKQGGRMIKTAAENATAANSTAKSTEESADALAKAAKASFTQGKRTKQASAQLSSVLDVTLEQLTELEGQAGEKQEVMLVEEDLLSSKSVMSNMETARSQLQSFTEILSELLKNLDEKVALQNFDHTLNATAARLRVLKAAVESPALTGKIQELHGAAHSQEKQLQSLEENLQEIREERNSLADIAQNLPKCPQSGN